MFLLFAFFHVAFAISQHLSTALSCILESRDHIYLLVSPKKEGSRRHTWINFLPLCCYRWFLGKNGEMLIYAAMFISGQPDEWFNPVKQTIQLNNKKFSNFWQNWLVIIYHIDKDKPDLLRAFFSLPSSQTISSTPMVLNIMFMSMFPNFYVFPTSM